MAESKPVINGVVFARQGKLVRKATGYEQEKAEAAPSHTGFAGCASQASGAHWSVSVTHRFLRRGKIKVIVEKCTLRGATSAALAPAPTTVTVLGGVARAATRADNANGRSQNGSSGCELESSQAD